MIVLRFLRTVAGWTAILFSTMAHALLIGLNGESDVSERLLRNWARLFLWVAGARVTVRYDAPLEKGCLRVVPGSHKLGILDHDGEGAWHEETDAEREDKGARRDETDAEHGDQGA